jgi:GTP-binding protein LepA
VLGLPAEGCLQVSARAGEGVEARLQALCERVPGPGGDSEGPTRALIFDSEYEDYQGVIVYFRLFEGTLQDRDRIRMMRSGRTYTVSEFGKFTPRRTPYDQPMAAGEVGYLTASIKRLSDITIGETITLERAQAPAPLPGYREPQPMVYCDFYPTGDTQYHDLRDAVERLHLNDSSFSFEPQTNEALGFGLRCGFLGMLHMEIIQERLEREHGAQIVQTAPTPTYEIVERDGEETTTHRIHNPADLPDGSRLVEVREPIARVEMLTPAEGVGEVMKLCESRRGTFKNQEVLTPERQMLTYEIPLAEILFGFYDRMKSITRGYGTMDYRLEGFRADRLVRVDVLVNGGRIDALSFIAHRDQAEERGRALLLRLKEVIERHMFEIPLQAAVGGRVLARETIKAASKNVTAKCYGGDVTRKRKLIEKQKEGKKRMKRVGTVDIPQEAFMAVLKADDG